MSLLLIPLVLVVLASSFYFYFTRNFNYWKKRNVLGPKPTVVFGNLLESTLRRKHISVVFRDIYEEFSNEKVVGIYRMTTPCLLIRDLDLIKHVMIKDFDVFTDRGVEFSKDGLGTNLFHADGDTWRILRNRFTPLFSSSKLKNMLYLMTERGDKFVDHVESLCQQQEEHEVHELLQVYTIATIAACAFGVDIDTMYDRMETLRELDRLILTSSYATELDMMYPGILKKINTSLFPPKVKDFFFELVKSVVTQRNGVPTNRNDFMDLLLELKKQREIQGTKRNADDKTLTLELTEDVMAAQAFIFYVGGYETSATTMAFTLYHLALNPDIQDKVIAEIDEVLERHNGQVTYETMKDMIYLDKVFSETLRMYPIVDPLQRNAQRDYTLPGTNVTIKKGQTIVVPAMGIHYDEKYYPNPAKFDPERFTAENVSERHPGAYLPFGIGPRNCIGMRFAKFQSRVCITKLLSKYRVEPSKNTPRNILMAPNRNLNAPKDGIFLNIIKRK